MIDQFATPGPLLVWWDDLWPNIDWLQHDNDRHAPHAELLQSQRQRVFDFDSFTLPRVSLLYLGTRPAYVHVFMSLAAGPILFCVGGLFWMLSCTHDWVFAGEDPLSPLLFNVIKFLLFITSKASR